MKLSINWLKKYVDLSGLSAKEVADAITLAGLEVEAISPMAQGTQLTIGYVVESVMHPDSDHLHVCQVDTGTGIRQIVCGAPNVAAGQKVIVALPGAVLPAKGVTITRSVVRGQESNGMICSLLELGLPESMLSAEQKEGIEVLAADAPLGHEDPLHYLGLDDVILEFKPTPNRGDSLALDPLFRDIAAILNRSYQGIEIPSIAGEKTSYHCSTSTSKCPVFRVRSVHGIRVQPSPLWLQDMLMAFGFRPINQIVDIGNYVMLITGQPLHMYDAKKLSSPSFDVSDTYHGPMVALDGKTYMVEPGDLVVLNGHDVVGLAGVMGSMSTMIDDSTTDVVIEAALFDAVTIRKTVRRTQLFSDASTRFIRGFDGARGEDALQLATHLIATLGGYRRVEEIVSSGDYHPTIPPIVMQLDRLNRRLGTAFTITQVETVFQRLGWLYHATETTITVTPPGYRPDVVVWEDLSEEVIRILGFSHLQLRDMPSTAIGELTEVQQKRRLLRDFLIAHGFFETINYSLVDPQIIATMNWQAITATIPLLLPMSDDHSVLRVSTLPSLVDRIGYNQARQQEDVHLFEWSSMYHAKGSYEVLGVATSGRHHQTRWLGAKTVDFYTVKGVAEAIFGLLGIEPTRYSYEPMSPQQEDFHPGQSAWITMGRTKLGVVGMIHPSKCKQFDVAPTAILELNMTEVFKLKSSKVKFVAPPTYPSVTRDFALVVPQSVSAAQLTKTIKKAGKALVSSIEVFDVYKGEHVAPGYQSVAVSITYRNPQKTLVDAEVSQAEQDILRLLSTECQAVLRA